MSAYLKPFFRPDDFPFDVDRHSAAQFAEKLLEAAFGNEYAIVMFWKERLVEERKEIERLREALEWYANANWGLDISQENIEEYSRRAFNDRGHRARAALAKKLS